MNAVTLFVVRDLRRLCAFLRHRSGQEHSGGSSGRNVKWSEEIFTTGGIQSKERDIDLEPSLNLKEPAEGIVQEEVSALSNSSLES
jgi:hypothetical protein